MAASAGDEAESTRPARFAASSHPAFAIRWAAFGERWRQLTFYLFDPNNWR